MRTTIGLVLLVLLLVFVGLMWESRRREDDREKEELDRTYGQHPRYPEIRAYFENEWARSSAFRLGWRYLAARQLTPEEEEMNAWLEANWHRWEDLSGVERYRAINAALENEFESDARS